MNARTSFDKRLILTSADAPGLAVRAITEDDLESLRQWKNAFRTHFFFTDVISPEMQQKWFEGYLSRPDDFMFVASHDDEKTGCLGFRRLDDRIDFYNIIRGRPRGAKPGVMSMALDLACSEARQRYPGLPLMVSVLRTNPALAWYFKRGFTLTKEHETFVELTRTI